MACAPRMSAFGPKQTWPRALHMSAFGGKADIATNTLHFGFGPRGNILPWRESEDLPRIEHRREPPEGDMQRRGESGQPANGQRTRPKARKAQTANVSAGDLQEQLVERLVRERDEALER